MQNVEALFLCQITFSIFYPKNSGVDGDPRKELYTLVSQFTNGYVVLEKGYGSGHVHGFDPTNPAELLN